jgi:hypothetical protein
MLYLLSLQVRCRLRRRQRQQIEISPLMQRISLLLFLHVKTEMSQIHQ